MLESSHYILKMPWQEEITILMCVQPLHEHMLKFNGKQEEEEEKRFHSLCFHFTSSLVVILY
jgi:hypothetical protein